MLFTELLPTKLGNGKSCTVLSGFSFIQLMIAGTKLVAKSFLQAVTAALTACCRNSFFFLAIFSRPQLLFSRSQASPSRQCPPDQTSFSASWPPGPRCKTPSTWRRLQRRAHDHIAAAGPGSPLSSFKARLRGVSHLGLIGEVGLSAASSW